MMDTFFTLTLELVFSLLEFGSILFLIILGIRAVIGGVSSEERAKLNITHLNERFKKRKSWLRHMMMSPETRDIAERLEAREEKSTKKQKARQAKKELKNKKTKRSGPNAKSTKPPQADDLQEHQELISQTEATTIDMNDVQSQAEVQLTNPTDQNLVSDPSVEDTVEPQTIDQEQSNSLKKIKSDSSHQSPTRIDQPEEEEKTPRLFVLNFKGDIQASAVESLREEITAVLQVKRSHDEVLLCLHNAGGYVHTHGLAASQLTRLTSAGIRLTVAIDQVAASGGYMMACVGRRIIAAPFAIIGSIGVVAQIPNVNRLLKRYDVDVELHTAGDYKRTLTVLGENTDEGRENFVEELHKTHNLFQNFVRSQRPKLDIEAVATGETWYGTSAIEVGLVDEIMTSDELILNALETHDVYLVEYRRKTKASERVLSWAHALFNGRLPEI